MIKKLTHQIYLDVGAIIVESTRMGNDRIVDADLGIIINFVKLKSSDQEKSSNFVINYLTWVKKTQSWRIHRKHKFICRKIFVKFSIFYTSLQTVKMIIFKTAY